MEFHVSRHARDRYNFDQSLFSLSGNVILADFHATRVFAQRMNEKRDLVTYPEQAVRSGQLNAMGLVDEIGPPEAGQSLMPRRPVAAPFSGGVWFDPEDQLFKTWYMAGWMKSLAYATSTDGIHWERPALDVVEGTNATLEDMGHLDSTLVFATWFAGGLRIVDVADPSLPAEVGYFIPEPVSGTSAPQSNDVDVGPDGLIYMIDRVNGFDILEFAG